MEKGVEFISDMSYIILRDRWCDIIVLQKLEHVFDIFPKVSYANFVR
jgi:hypothetical protein